MILKSNAESEAEQTDATAWRIGVYIACAIGATFGDSEYPEAPLCMQENEEEDERKDEIASLNFKAWAEAYNRQKGADDGGDSKKP